MESYKLTQMAQVIREDDGICPLTFSEIMQHHGGCVFVIGEKCGYGTVDVTKMAVLLDGEYVDIHGCGTEFYAYDIRPDSVK